MADTSESKVLDYEPADPSGARDDWAYIAPMGVFLLFTWAGGNWPDLYPATYVAKAILAAILMIVLRRHYTKIRWNHWWLGVVVGVIGVVQWIAMEKLLPYPKMSHEPIDPNKIFAHEWSKWSFIAVRWAGASLVVPFMEELFWRDFLWRSIIAPNDFKLARVGEWDWKAFVIVALAFGLGVHIEWLSAIVWGAMIGGLLLWTRSLGACIVAHAVTNFLLGAYVLKTGEWVFW